MITVQNYRHNVKHTFFGVPGELVSLFCLLANDKIIALSSETMSSHPVHVTG